MGGVLPVSVRHGSPQLLQIEHGLGAEQLQHLALEGALAKRVAGQMHKIDRPVDALARAVALLRGNGP